MFMGGIRSELLIIAYTNLSMDIIVVPKACLRLIEMAAKIYSRYLEKSLFDLASIKVLE